LLIHNSTTLTTLFLYYLVVEYFIHCSFLLIVSLEIAAMPLITPCLPNRVSAGAPPMMPVYSGWLECYTHLRSVNGLKRGSSVLWRRYTGPVFLKGTDSGHIMLQKMN